MIEKVALGAVRVNGVNYNRDIMIVGGRVKSWEREGAFVVDTNELQEAIWAQPEVIIIGTGFRSHFFVPYEVRDFFKSHGAHIIVDTTANACKIYNDISQVKNTVIALKVTE